MLPFLDVPRPRFNPLRLPGLAAWYDAADSSTVLTTVGPDVPATNGQPVRRWLDKSGNGRHLDQVNLVIQPKLLSGGIEGDGTGYFSNTIITAIPQPYTIFGVVKKISASASSSLYNESDQAPQLYSFPPTPKFEFTGPLIHNRAMPASLETSVIHAACFNGASGVSFIKHSGTLTRVAGNTGTGSLVGLGPTRAAAGDLITNRVIQLIYVAGVVDEPTLLRAISWLESRHP